MKKPWNLINLPIYSLATYANNEVNMNICTYVSAISMTPKKYMIAVYENTKTLENITNSSICVLQLLHESQFTLTKSLGQTSGFTFNKNAYLYKKDAIEIWENLAVLKNVSARVLLKKEQLFTTGDHHLITFDVLKYKTYNSSCLTLDTLREKKLIRI
jgi:flavin reductase (DIM6/NTAB) family NADH-FMN oxidoreductase RutF